MLRYSLILVLAWTPLACGEDDPPPEDPGPFYCDSVNDFTLLGSFEVPNGPLTSVAVSGTLAFVTNRSTLFVVDLRYPATPTGIGEVDFQNDRLKQVAVDGRWVYVADPELGLQVVDAADPHNPGIVGSYSPPGGGAYGVAIDGTRAYVGALAAGLDILDVTDPTTPTFLGRFSGSDEVHGVVVIGATAYAREVSTAGVRVIDAANPTAPLSLGRTAGLQLPVDLAVAHGGLLVIDQTLGGLRIFDVSDPTAPLPQGDLATQRTARGVAIGGSLAYVTDSASLMAVDWRNDPLNPARTAELEVTPPTTAVSGGDVTVMENLILVADGSSGISRLRVIQACERP